MKHHSSIDVANYLLSKAEERKNPLTPMQIIKLVYLCHGWMLGLYGRPLINEPVEAWQYGPVIRNLYRSVREYKSSHIDRKITGGSDLAEFDDAELDVMDQVIGAYGDSSGIKLSKMTHAIDTPWSITWKDKGKNSVISNDIIQEHFSRLYEKYAHQNNPAKD